MGRGSGTGTPLWFQCSECRIACRKWRGRHGRPYRRGQRDRVELTGRRRPVNDGNARGRSANVRVEYRCLDCGHVGWTRHTDLAKESTS